MEGETWRQLLAEYLGQPAPADGEQLALLVRGLADWPKPVWVAAAVGALEAHLLLRPITHPDLLSAQAAAAAWLACPCARHALLAQEAAVAPRGLWGNCNDLLHVGRIAAYHVALAAGPAGSVDNAIRAATAMAHPLVCEPAEVWAAILAKLRGLIG